jgi:alcohol dehydrogenase (cytochrome c)
MFTAGKIGIYDALDAKSGSTCSRSISDSTTWSRDRSEDRRQDDEAGAGAGRRQVKMVCPHAAGAKNWLPASYSPPARRCSCRWSRRAWISSPVPGGGRGGLSTGVNLGVRPRPDSDGNYGRLQAINLETRKTVWTTRHRAPDHHRHADDGGRRGVRGRARPLPARLRRRQREGAVGDAAQRRVERGADLVCVNGKQYIAIVAGRGGFHYASYAPLVPELAAPPDRGLVAVGVRMP